MPQSCPPAWYAPAALGHGSGSVTMNGAQVQARTSVATMCISDHSRLQCLRARPQPSVCYCSPVLLANSWPLWGKQHNGMMGSCSRVRSRRSPLTLGLGRGQRRRNLREPGSSSRARGAGQLQLMHIACCWGRLLQPHKDTSGMFPPGRGCSLLCPEQHWARFRTKSN